MTTRAPVTRTRGSARTAAVIGLVVGILFTALILLDPFHLTHLDERLRGEPTGGPTGSAAASIRRGSVARKANRFAVHTPP